MTTVNLYRVYCNTEATYVNTWDINEPTVCPTNASHSIDSASTKILDSVSTNKVSAMENTDGYFETTTITMVIPAGSPGTVTEHDITWPMNILVWNTHITPTTPMIDDVLTVIALPETTIGVLTATAAISDTILTVNSTVITNAYRGFLVTLDDGVNKDVCGRIININATNSTITVETPLTHSFNAGAPFKISVYMLKDIYISDANTISIGQKGFRGKQLDANNIIRVYYKNNSGTEKTIRWRPEYYNLG